jgi:hypothetical protein
MVALTLDKYTTELQYGPTGLNLMEPDEEWQWCIMMTIWHEKKRKKEYMDVYP